MKEVLKLLTASHVLPITSDPIAGGGLALDGDTIAEVGNHKDLRKRYPRAEVEEYPNAVLMPGLVNPDTHLELLSFDPTGQDGFIGWVLARIEYAQRLGTGERRANIQEGILRLLQSGTTCAGDVGKYTGTLPLLQDSPIRWTLFPEVMTSTHPTTTENYQSVLATLDEIIEKKTDRLSAGLAPFSAYSLSRNLLMVLAREAEAKKVPLKIRVAESFAEMQFFYESTGEILEKVFPKLGWQEATPPIHRKTPLQFLESLGFLAGQTILVGCLHLSDADHEILKKTKCGVVWTPRLQKRLQSGQAPVKKWLAAKVPVGIGSDGNGSRGTLSLWDEMRAAAELCPAREVLTMATWGGARVLRRDREIGSLETGKKGDLIAVQLSSKGKKIFEQLIERTSDREIAAVFINGEKVSS